MKDYLKNAKELSMEQRIQLESYQAILKNITGEYSESIMLFYDILDKSQDEPATPTIITAQSVSINYIAEMYYTFEDYDKAKEYYKECDDFLKNSEGSTFFDTEAYFKLTECNILIKEN